ncbi:MAG TPA: RNA polymerase subunit sigma [Lysinibacillus sp.]|nr:RNA polymerase subunit sigma [Lysinibacillus sp.]
MERTEQKLKKGMKADHNMVYPDFEQMWSSIEQDELKITEGETVEQRPRRRKKFALVAGLAVALMATPVYAALNYDWSNILSYRAGIQSALAQGLGQTIEQSITKDGFTLTVHTAFIDDNRTFLLYSLKPEASWDGEEIGFEFTGLKDAKGNFIEGNYTHSWNEELGVFQGYFETDWVVEGQMADVEFTMENMQFISNEKHSISYNPNDLTTQVFLIQKGGIDTVTIQSFEQDEGKVLLKSAVTLTDSKVRNTGIFIEAINDRKNSIENGKRSFLGNQGAKGEYFSQQLFESDALHQEGTKFQISYNRVLETKESDWSIKLNLTKKQLENASFKQVLNIPIDNVPGGTKIHEMTVTPTQVRLILTQKKYETFPYRDYQLDVGGTLLTGYMSGKGGNPNETELRFEMNGLNAASLENQSVTFVAKHRVEGLYGDDNSTRLTNISANPQSVTSNIAGYPISWTYYMKDNNLYVESLSSDPGFAGVNQTYYLEGKEEIYGTPEFMGMLENNKRMDVYENFDKKELEILVYNYLINKPNDESRMPLTSGK